MIAEGKLFEFQGDHEKAVRNYIDTIKFAHSLDTYPYNFWRYIGTTIKMPAYESLMDCLAEKGFEMEFLFDVKDELKSIKSTPIQDVFSATNQIMKNEIKGFRFNLKKSYFGELKPIWVFANNLYLVTHRTRIIRNSEDTVSEINRVISKPYHVLKKYGHKTFYKNMNLYSKHSYSLWHSDVTRDYIVRNQAAATKVMVDLILYKMENGRYPDDLSSFPVDPFTDKPFLFIKDETSFQIYSPGLDIIDDKAKIESKPGISISGDIIFPKLY